MATVFAAPGNNVSTTVGSAYTAGDYVSTGMILATGSHTKFPTLSGGQYYRVTVCQVAFAYSPTATTANYTIYKSTGFDGTNLDKLIGMSVISTGLDATGNTDRNYAVGDIVEIRVTAGTLGDIHTAVNALENAGGGGMSIGGTVTGGTANRVLYEGASHVLADSSALTFDGATMTLTGPSSDTTLVNMNVHSTGSTLFFFTRTSTSQRLFLGFNGTGTPTDPVWFFGTGSGSSDFQLSGWDSTNGLIQYFSFVPGTGSVFGNTGTVAIRGDGTIVPVTMANASAAANSLFIDSSASNKLCWKDGSNNLHYST